MRIQIAGSWIRNRIAEGTLGHPGPGFHRVSGHRDPLVLAGVVLAMLFLGLLATWIPARRALSVDPMVLVRSDWLLLKAQSSG
jgi:ABC-type lipoprotein release transport system permease subunit